MHHELIWVSRRNRLLDNNVGSSEFLPEKRGDDESALSTSTGRGCQNHAVPTPVIVAAYVAPGLTATMGPRRRRARPRWREAAIRGIC